MNREKSEARGGAPGRSGGAGVAVREVRVFFGSSREMVCERQAFPGVLERLNQRPEIARTYRLVPVRWEVDAYGLVGDDVDETIQQTVDFEHLDVVVIGVWNRIGGGTEGEYEAARDLYRFRGRPRLLLFCRRSEATTAEELERLDRFRDRVIHDGGVPNAYDDCAEFEQRLAQQLPELLPRAERRDPAPLRSLERLFLASSLVGFLLSALLLWFPSTMSAPDWGFTYCRVLAVLVLPPVVALVFGFTLWLYHRLLNKLVELWHSPDWDDGALYAAFRSVVPAWAIPRRLRDGFPSASGTRAAVSLLLVLVLATPVVAQYQALFQEILGWPYVCGRSVVEDAAGLPVVEEKPRGPTVESRWVDRAPRRPWTFGLRDPRVAERRRSHPHEILYVHSEGRFHRDRDLPPEELVRHNLGPEIFLPWQPLIYFLLIVAGAVGVLLTLVRLLRLSGELAPALETSHRIREVRS